MVALIHYSTQNNVIDGKLNAGIMAAGKSFAVLSIGLLLVAVQCSSKKVDSVLQLGMTSSQVVQVLGKATPDSIKAGLSTYNNVELLGVKGKCIIRYDSAGHLSFFTFMAPWGFRGNLKQSAYSHFGIPRDTMKSEEDGHFWVVFWKQGNALYNYSEMGSRCSVGGGIESSVSPLAAPNFPPPP